MRSFETRYPIPVASALRKLGSDIRTARRRRRIPTALLSERAQISRMTLYKIERGDTKVAVGSYGAVLFALGLVEKLRDLVDPAIDHHGFHLEESRLPKRIRGKQS